jgi:hypothetical protein
MHSSKNVRRMVMKHGAIVAATVLGIATLTSSVAGATVFTVDALTPLGSFQDTGISLNPGTTYDFTVINPATIWSAGSDIPYSRDSDANGIPASRGYGQWTEYGYTFNFGALVGEIGSNPSSAYFFLIGTGPTILNGLSGELQVGFWDSFYPDNSGSQTLSVTATPLPAALPLFAGGLGIMGLIGGRRRKSKKQSALATA